MVFILTVIEIALIAVAGFSAWQTNRAVSRMQPGVARVALRAGANFVAVAVILLLLVFLAFQTGG